MRFIYDRNGHRSEVMRNEKLVDIIKLAQALAASAEGLTLDEMASFSGAGRRTAERRRDAISEAFGPLDEIQDGRQIRFRLTGRGLSAFAASPTAEELAELENAARTSELEGDAVRATALRSLHRKIRSSLRQGEKARLATDMEAQLQAEAFAQRVGPHPFADPGILLGLRHALLAGLIVKFHYQLDPKGPARWRRVVPYGLIFGPRYYLVANVPSRPAPVLYRLDRISNLELTSEAGAPPESFDLETYAKRSFGIFQEEPADIVLRFDPEVADEAKAYVFHSEQTILQESDGSVTARFSAGGLLELAQHLMRWGPNVTIIAPDRLGEIMRDEVQALHDHYRRPASRGKRSR